MHRRQFLTTSGYSLALLALMNNKALSGILRQSYDFRLLRNNVGIFTEQGGTIAWLANKDGIAVVDSEFQEPANHLIGELKKQSAVPFRYLINTHHHGDHTSGNIAFKGLTGKVVAHENSLTNQKRVAAEQKSEDKQLYPDTTFRDDMDVRVGGENIKLYYYGAAHTDGDAIIHFENANIVHMGDLVFNRRYPYIDKTAGADIRNWIKVLDKAAGKFDKDTTYIFGHALDPKKVTGNREDLIAFRDYLNRLLEQVGREIKAGRSKEQILDIKAIEGAPEWQGEGIGRSLTAAYEELTSQKGR
jgi:glyoxylase-like metal-dependent hydrolase (beta-lactamase superfamily II)